MYISKTYLEIINKTKTSDIPLERAGKSLRMRNHTNPYCIADIEFEFINNFVTKYKLKRGYEVATAFGVSMLAPALAMKKYGGRLLTMDAYIEERHNSCVAYRNIVEVHCNSDGFKSAKSLIKMYNLSDVVTPYIGFSPRDTKAALDTTFDLTKEKLDYVFIDGLHTDEAIIRDLKSISQYLDRDNGYVVFFHDVHCFNSSTRKVVAKILGKEWKIIPQCTHPGNGFNLAMVTNLER